jgi:hypothetical protein
MTWSLGVEEQFYVVVPLVMVLVVRLRRSLLLPALLIVCAISFLWACLALNSHPGLVFYMLPTRAWELGVGVVLAVVELRRRRKSLPTWLIQALSVIGLALMLGPVFAFGIGRRTDSCHSCQLDQPALSRLAANYIYWQGFLLLVPLALAAPGLYTPSLSGQSPPSRCHVCHRGSLWDGRPFLLSCRAALPEIFH